MRKVEQQQLDFYGGKVLTVMQESDDVMAALGSLVKTFMKTRIFSTWQGQTWNVTFRKKRTNHLADSTSKENAQKIRSAISGMPHHASTTNQMLVN